MTEMILNTKALPEALFRLIKTEKVKIHEADGEIRVIPVNETNVDCPLFGMFADGKISVDKFMASKQTEKELEA